MYAVNDCRHTVLCYTFTFEVHTLADAYGMHSAQWIVVLFTANIHASCLTSLCNCKVHYFTHASICTLSLTRHSFVLAR